MVGVFRRSLSFPNKPSQNNKPHLSHHIRSISLPCRSHPLISHIKDEINNLTTISQTSSNISHCLNGLKDIHDTLQHILHLPQTQESLRRHPLFFEKLLEDFLRFVEVFAIFQTSILAFKEELSAVQVAVRKRDSTKIVLYIKAKRKMVKEMKKLMSCIRRVIITQPDIMLKVPSFGDAELVGIIGDVINVTVSISVGLFDRIAVSFTSKKLTWTQIVKLSRTKKEVIEDLEDQDDGVESFLVNMKKNGIEEVRSVLKRMRDLEECICGIECVSQKVLRALINSRVALLNTLSQ